MNTLRRTQSYRIQGCDAVGRAVYRILNKILYLRILGSVEFSATRIVSVSNHLDASLYAISRVCMYDARWQEKHLFSEAPISLSASEPILTFRFVHNIFFSLQSANKFQGEKKRDFERIGNSKVTESVFLLLLNLTSKRWRQPIFTRERLTLRH